MRLCKESIKIFRCTTHYNMLHFHRVNAFIIQQLDHRIIKYILQRKQQRYDNYKFLRKFHSDVSYSPNHTNMLKQAVKKQAIMFPNFFEEPCSPFPQREKCWGRVFPSSPEIEYWEFAEDCEKRVKRSK